MNQSSRITGARHRRTASAASVAALVIALVGGAASSAAAQECGVESEGGANTICGHVETPEGVGIAGVEVTASGEDGLGIATTDASGFFAILVGAGEWTVAVNADTIPVGFGSEVTPSSTAVTVVSDTDIHANVDFVVSDGEGAAFLVIDEDSIDNGNAPNNFSSRDVNDDIAEIGVRTQLRFFAQHVGQQITLYTGQVGDEGWFALKTIPVSWANAGPTSDGLKNYVVAGPGLGRPDTKGDRESRLDKVPDVTPLRATGLRMLEGRTVCAVVYDSDVSINYGPLNGSLKGANLGVVAFRVLDVTRRTGASSSSLPKALVEIQDAAQVCAGELTLFVEGPVPTSSSQPFDTGP